MLQNVEENFFRHESKSLLCGLIWFPCGLLFLVQFETVKEILYGFTFALPIFEIAYYKFCNISFHLDLFVF